MKLAKFVLTPPIVAISVALCAALSSFGATSDDYIQDGLIANFDAIENAGKLTFNPNATTWKNLVGDFDATLQNAYDGCWTGGALKMNASLYATFEADLGTSFTVEIIGTMPLAEQVAAKAEIFGSTDNAYQLFRPSATATYLQFKQPVYTSTFYFYSYDGSSVDLMFENNDAIVVYQQKAPDNNTRKTGTAAATGLKTWTIGGQGEASALTGEIRAIRVYNRALSLKERQQNARVDKERFTSGKRFQVDVVNVANSCAGVSDEIVPSPALGAYALTPGAEMSFSVNKSSYTSGSETGKLLGWTLTTIRGGQTLVLKGTSSPCVFTPEAGDAVLLTWDWERTDVYHWAKTASASWQLADSWRENVIPPSDINSVEAVFPAVGGGGNYYISGGAEYLKKMTVTAPPSSVHNQFVGFQNTGVYLGSGGISMLDTVGRTYVYFQKPIYVECDQTWALDATVNENICGATIYGSLYLPKDVTLTTTGRRSGLQFTNGDGSNCDGHLRTNGRLSFNSLNRLSCLGTADIYWTNNALDGYPVATNADGKALLEFQCAADVEKSVTFANDITFDFTNPNYTTMWWYFDRKNTYPMPVDYKATFTGKWSGKISDDLVKFTYKRTSDSTTILYDPFHAGRIVFDTDGAGLSTEGSPHFRYHFGVYEVARNDALGAGNKVGAVFGSLAAADVANTGAAVAYIAAPGVTIGGDIKTSMDDIPGFTGYLYNVHGFQIYLGTFEAGEVWYTGDIANRDSKWTKSANGYAYSTPDQFRLTAVEGATAHFSGKLSGGKAFPFEIHGAGTVELSGDNSGIAQGLSVRGGSLVLASADSAGAETLSISLGATVPSVADVEFFDNMVGTANDANFKKIWTVGANNASFTKIDGQPIVFDGVEMQVGERIYIDSELPGAAFGVYTMTSATTLEKNTDFVFEMGQRIRIEKGVKYGGTAKMILRNSNGGVRGGVWEPQQPAVKVLAKNGMTIANPIDVTDNKSTGVSAIGSADASTVTFSGAITLAKDVVFEAAAGSTVNVTGSVSNEGGYNIGFAGLGTTVFASPLDITGREITVTLPVDVVPTEGALKYVLAAGLSGKPASVTLVTADGSSVPAEWSARISGPRLVFRNKPAGFQILVR